MPFFSSLLLLVLKQMCKDCKQSHVRRFDDALRVPVGTVAFQATIKLEKQYVVSMARISKTIRLQEG